MAGPMVLGEDPDTGHGLDLTVYDEGGAWHTFIVAATGGGKTTLYSNMAEDATGRTDVLV
jgi:type IV secretory pathway VirB4 component